MTTYHTTVSEGRAPARSFAPLLALALLASAFLASVLLAGCANPQGTSSTSAAADATSSVASPEASSATSTSDATSATAQAALDNANIDYAATFPSWQANSASLHKLVDYVAAVTDPSSPDYVEPADRIATFDMDGTIICEKAPYYVDWCFMLNRVLDNPSYNEPGYQPPEEDKAPCQELRDSINAGKTPTAEQVALKDRLTVSEFAGLTPEQYRADVLAFATSNSAVGFEGMTYADSFYQPMLEVIDYLKANDFDVWMVSACEREFVRGLVPSKFDISLDHIIATDVGMASTNQGDATADKYNMEQSEEIVLTNSLGQETGKNAKSVAIMREIGKRPILAFGNSSGDYSMLNFAQGNPDHKGMGVLVLCDDTEREYGDLERAAEQTAEAEKQGWTIFHMNDTDWATIYGEGVKKTALPGASEAEILVINQDQQQERELAQAA